MGNPFRLYLLARQPLRPTDPLRHSSASLAPAGGVPLRVESERIGHSSIGITADLYTKVYDHVGREAAEQISAVIPRRRSAGA